MTDIQPLPGFEGVVANPLDEAQLKSEQARQLFEAQYGDADWLDDYFALRGEGWDWRKAFYILWASMPKDRRTPKTQGGLALLLGLTSDRVIRQWQVDNPGIRNRIDALIRTTLGKARAEIYTALIASASDPSPKAHSDRKLALEMMGDYTPKQAITVGPNLENPGGATEADLSALADIPAAGSSEVDE